MPQLRSHWGQHPAAALVIIALSALLAWHAELALRLVALALGAGALVLLHHQPNQLEPRGRAGFTQIDSVQLDLSPAAAEETRDTAFAAFSERLRDMLLGLQQHNLRIALDSAKNRAGRALPAPPQPGGPVGLISGEQPDQQRPAGYQCAHQQSLCHDLAI